MCQECTELKCNHGEICGLQPELNSSLSDLLVDVDVKMGIDIHWKSPADSQEEKARRQDIDVAIQRRVFELRQRIREELMRTVY